MQKAVLLAWSPRTLIDENVSDERWRTICMTGDSLLLKYSGLRGACDWGCLSCTSATHDMRLHLLHLCRCFTKWRTRSRACFTRMVAAEVAPPLTLGEGAMAM